MDIEEYKKLAKNKLEADALTKQVRARCNKINKMAKTRCSGRF